MSPCSSSVCLLVLLGVVLASSSPVQFISENMKHTHDSIANDLGLKQPEIGSNPLFSSVIKSLNTSCQRRDDVQLMNATLDVYMRIFSSILQHDQHQNHHRQVTKFQQWVKTLKNRLSHLNHEKEDVFSKLNKIKVDDPLVQKKALAEFLEVYQAASVIDSQSC